jgi:hypothetical protein
MGILQNISKYYIKNIPNVNPIGCKVMKLTYTRKIAFNVNGTTIHFTLAILFKNNLNKFEALNDEKHDSLIKIYY